MRFITSALLATLALQVYAAPVPDAEEPRALAEVEARQLGLLNVLLGGVTSTTTSTSTSSSGSTSATSALAGLGLGGILTSLTSLLTGILGGGSPLAILNILGGSTSATTSTGSTTSLSQLDFLQGILSGFQSGALDPTDFASLAPQIQQALNVLSAQSFLSGIPIFGSLVGGTGLVGQIVNLLTQLLSTITGVIPAGTTA